MLFILFAFIGILLLFLSNKVEQKKPTLFGGLLLLALAVFQCLTVVPAGNVGVIDFFGNVSTNTLKAGINFVNPLAKVIKFSIRTQEIKETMSVPSKEGLSIKMEVSVLFHVNPEKAAEIYKTVGLSYVETILEPQFRSIARGVTAQYEAKALYTSEREALASLIKKDLDVICEKRGIVIETTPLRTVVLPPGLTRAIELKLEAEQESQRMQFVLLKEKQEAERKSIEAEGVSNFQKIVSSGISDNLLRWKGIEATEKLAHSQNTKVIIVGGKDGLPLILDTK